MEFLSNSLQLLRSLWPKIGPYVLIEIALPGGTLLALLLYLYRRAEVRVRTPRSPCRAIPAAFPGLRPFRPTAHADSRRP